MPSPRTQARRVVSPRDLRSPSTVYREDADAKTLHHVLRADRNPVIASSNTALPGPVATLRTARPRRADPQCHNSNDSFSETVAATGAWPRCPRFRACIFSQRRAGHRRRRGTAAVGRPRSRSIPSPRARTARVSLSDTIVNCAGGTTPWHSWTTCEETNVGPSGNPSSWLKQPGYCFDVSAGANGFVQAVAIPEMGRFRTKPLRSIRSRTLCTKPSTAAAMVDRAVSTDSSPTPRVI